ncbi:MAG: hypothetical protein JNK60_08110, partial [Acidobacteria bacterium]|nr:hypothetical protein [Acidobacteriota bacterium]
MKSPGLIGLVLVVSTAGLLSLFDASRDSATADEPIHVVAGMVQAQTGTWIVNVEHPPLAKQLYGWAAGLVGARDTPPLSYGDFFRSTRKALFLQRGAVPRDRVLLASRIVAIALFLALIVAAYFAASAGASGLLAAALLAGQTAVFPHGHLANTDIPMALFVMLAVHLALVCGRTIPEPSGNLCARHAALAAVLALALATKASAIILLGLIPLLLATFAFTGPAPQRWRRLVLAAAVPIVAVAMLAFLLSFWMRNDPLHTPARLSAIYRLSASDGELLRGLEGFSRGLSRYAMTVLVVLRLSEAGRLTYFLGEVSPRPSAAFHLTAILVKSPLVWLLSVGAGAILVVRNGWRSRDARIRDGEAMTAAVFLFSGLFLLAASLPGPRIGVRHVFPTIALLTVSAAAVLGPTVVTRSRHALTALVLLGISP